MNTKNFEIVESNLKQIFSILKSYNKIDEETVEKERKKILKLNHFVKGKFLIVAKSIDKLEKIRGSPNKKIYERLMSTIANNVNLPSEEALMFLLKQSIQTLNELNKKIRTASDEIVKSYILFLKESVRDMLHLHTTHTVINICRTKGQKEKRLIKRLKRIISRENGNEIVENVPMKIIYQELGYKYQMFGDMFRSINESVRFSVNPESLDLRKEIGGTSAIEDNLIFKEKEIKIKKPTQEDIKGFDDSAEGPDELDDSAEGPGDVDDSAEGPGDVDDSAEGPGDVDDSAEG